MGRKIEGSFITEEYNLIVSPNTLVLREQSVNFSNNGWQLFTQHAQRKNIVKKSISHDM